MTGTNTGTFLTAPQGSIVGTFGTGNLPLYIYYNGGDGNDVVLDTVPEPSTFVLAFLGLMGLAAYIWRRRRSA